SLGMTFSVDLEAKQLQVTASWGQYLKQPSEYLVSEKTGAPRRIWKRYPRGGTHSFKLAEGPILPVAVDANCPEVSIQGVVRKRSDHWSVTLFLVNEQQEPLRLRDTAWVFQPELVAQAVDGSAALYKKLSVVDMHSTDLTVQTDNQMLSMLYRRQVEFAVGHGV